MVKRSWILLYITLSILFCSRLQAETPEVWMGHIGVEQLVEDPANWSFVCKNIDGIQVFIDWIPKCPPDTLKKLVAILNENSIQLMVECGGTLEYAPLDETNGEKSAEIELAKIEPLIQAGRVPDFLNLDHPVVRLLEPGEGKQPFPSVEAAVKEYGDYLKAIHTAQPGIQFFELTNFPNWGWRGNIGYHGIGKDRMGHGDYAKVLPLIIEGSRQLSIPIRGVTADNPYDYTIGRRPSATLENPTEINWMGRVLDLENRVEADGLEFNLIINSEEPGFSSAEEYSKQTLQFLDEYQAAGGSPKRFLVESWYDEPKKVVPETEPYTMTNLVKAVIEKVRTPANGK
jgi:hypothetical protein